MISGSESDSGNLNSFVMSCMTRVQNLRSFGRGLRGFGVVCVIQKFLSSLGLNLCVIRVFGVVEGDLKVRLSSYDVMGRVGMFG